MTTQTQAPPSAPPANPIQGSRAFDESMIALAKRFAAVNRGFRLDDAVILEIAHALSDAGTVLRATRVADQLLRELDHVPTPAAIYQAIQALAAAESASAERSSKRRPCDAGCDDGWFHTTVCGHHAIARCGRCHTRGYLTD